VTICQVRDASHFLLDALTLNADDQQRRLAKAARIIRSTQAANAAARASHAKAHQRQLKTLGIHLKKLRCCIPAPSG
jgi:hypothetical protein